MGRKTLVTGSWNDAPNGCSVQSGWDWAAHWNTGSGNNNGSYTPVCSGDGLALTTKAVTDFETVTLKNVANKKWVEARQQFDYLSCDAPTLTSYANFRIVLYKQPKGNVCGIDCGDQQHKGSDGTCKQEVEFVPEYTATKASSIWNNEQIGVGHGQGLLNSPQAWSAKQNAKGEYWQMDAGSVRPIVGLRTQCRKDISGYNAQCVTSYKVMASMDGELVWFPVDSGRIFRANKPNSGDAVVGNKFSASIKARFVRIVVQTWTWHVSLRAALILGLNCSQTGIPPKGLCSQTYGQRCGSHMQADLASEGFTSLSTFEDICPTYCSSEAQAETAATTIWEPAGVWTKVSSKFCDKYDQSKKFDSVSAAKAACASSTSCSAVYDSSCDGVDYMLCEEEHTVTSSTQGSCLYQRSGTSLSVSTKYSSWKYGYNKELEYLDRQKPDCGADNAMQSFQVKRDGNNLRYKTKCSGSVPFSYTATYKTSCTPMQGYELEYLDRQNVACGGNQVLRSFKVIESGCSGYDRRYEYQCGNVQ
jgi:hypothetical protein